LAINGNLSDFVLERNLGSVCVSAGAVTRAPILPRILDVVMATWTCFQDRRLAGKTIEQLASDFAIE